MSEVSCLHQSLEEIVSCSDVPLAQRCKVCNVVFVLDAVEVVTKIKTCAFKPCSKLFETALNRHNGERDYCSTDCKLKMLDVRDTYRNVRVKTYLVEVWRPRSGEKAGDAAGHRPNDPDHSFYVRANHSEAARIAVHAHEGVKKGDTFRMTLQEMEESKTSAGLVVTGKIK